MTLGKGQTLTISHETELSKSQAITIPKTFEALSPYEQHTTIQHTFEVLECQYLTCDKDGQPIFNVKLKVIV